MRDFLKALEIQRWDDHRYYHHSRINQSLHFISAISFLCCYALLFSDPAAAGLIGWLVAMISRQAGHFVFEPRGYDEINHATHEYKEAVKVGYNLQRKTVLMAIWALSPLALYLDPELLGLFADDAGPSSYPHRLGLLWLAIGAGGLAFRTLHLFILKNPQTGLVWLAKILTDPFHDIKLYYRSPVRLLRGELMDPMADTKHASEQHA